MFLALPDMELILRNIHRSEGRCSPNSLFTSFTVWDFPYAPLLRAFKKTMNAPFPEEGYTGKFTFASTAVVAPIDDKFFCRNLSTEREVILQTITGNLLEVLHRSRIRMLASLKFDKMYLFNGKLRF